MWTRSPWTRSPKSSKCGREVRKVVNVDSKYWTRSPESSKYHGCYAVETRWLALIAICRTIKNLLDNGIRYAAVKALICWRLLPLLGRLPVYWGCPGLVIGTRALGWSTYVPRGIGNQSLPFGSPRRPMESFCFGDANGGPAFKGPDARPPGLLLALHIETFSKLPKRLYRLFDAPLSCVGEPIGSRVGVDNLTISLGDPWSAQCAKARGDCFVYLSFYSPFATVTRLGAVPLNLKGMNSHFATTARLGIFSRASLLP
ncbi:hypothetical protein CRG98_028341 [Punica granatum]|uniref:Uncharacterized protein n=1 Tax=Punica granatum TaxID=22663 RepID=A0A2I0J4W9_PUNGR|nr:hypothetical protein CRG98_028341 [Punica granatum]